MENARVEMNGVDLEDIFLSDIPTVVICSSGDEVKMFIAHGEWVEVLCHKYADWDVVLRPVLPSEGCVEIDF